MLYDDQLCYVHISERVISFIPDIKFITNTVLARLFLHMFIIMVVLCFGKPPAKSHNCPKHKQSLIAAVRKCVHAICHQYKTLILIFYRQVQKCVSIKGDLGWTIQFAHHARPYLYIDRSNMLELEVEDPT